MRNQKYSLLTLSLVTFSLVFSVSCTKVPAELNALKAGQSPKINTAADKATEEIKNTNEAKGIVSKSTCNVESQTEGTNNTQASNVPNTQGTNPTATPNNASSTPTTVKPNPTAAPTVIPTTKPTTAPAPSVKPTAPATSNSNYKALQDKIFELTNVERQKNGLAAFKYSAAVEKYAVDKSTDMAVNNYFDHKSPTKGYFYDIWKRDGYKYSAGAENIYYSTGTSRTGTDALAKQIVDGWMNSPGHRANILNAKYQELGVGVAEKDGKLYATQIFHTN